MDRIFLICSKIFNTIFITTGNGYPGLLKRVIIYILYSPILYIGTVLLIIGFSVGILRRIIHS